MSLAWLWGLSTPIISELARVELKRAYPVKAVDQLPSARAIVVPGWAIGSRRRTLIGRFMN